MTAIEYDDPFAEPPLLARALHLGPRAGAIVGLAFWVAACATLALHVAHAAGLSGDLLFVTVEAWLLTGACLGIPVMALRILGPRLTPSACISLGTALSACGMLLTLLYASGAFTPTPADGAIGLILCGGLAMRCFNAADALRAMRAARYEHRTDCVMAEAMTEHDLAEALAALTPQQRAAMLRALSIAIQPGSAASPLHLVDDFNGLHLPERRV